MNSIEEKKENFWLKWLKLTNECQWAELEKLDRLSYDHAATWINGAVYRAKSDLLAKVLEILNSGHINEDMFGWLCKLAEQDMLPAPSAIVEKTKEFTKKRISEAI